MLTQLLIERLPGIVRAAEPMSRIDRSTLVNTGGNGSRDGLGLNAVNQEVIKVLASMREVVNALTGVDLRQILSNLGEQALAASEPQPKTDGHVDEQPIEVYKPHAPSADDGAQTEQ